MGTCVLVFECHMSMWAVGTTLGRKECSGQGPRIQGKDLLTKCMCVCVHTRVCVEEAVCRQDCLC